ncbi:hypothetical protein Baya_16629 [Bagarius yarrelli]|uniref:Uncharacterized protein n=1 Tax=Bagarius yarrelli TaxID=175774 RepID=A0A556VVZ6_BAGYA|nr:hypothetical protein Baya_16629 [Bagarius yarrelli]
MMLLMKDDDVEKIQSKAAEYKFQPQQIRQQSSLLNYTCGLTPSQTPPPSRPVPSRPVPSHSVRRLTEKSRHLFNTMFPLQKNRNVKLSPVPGHKEQNKKNKEKQTKKNNK